MLRSRFPSRPEKRRRIASVYRRYYYAVDTGAGFAIALLAIPAATLSPAARLSKEGQ